MAPASRMAENRFTSSFRMRSGNDVGAGTRKAANRGNEEPDTTAT